MLWIEPKKSLVDERREKSGLTLASGEAPSKGVFSFEVMDDRADFSEIGDLVDCGDVL
jgi:hypothetical protein